MSNQEMANRLKGILLTKANMGMGYGEGVKRKKRSRKGGEGVTVGGANRWISFIKELVNDPSNKKHGYTYSFILKDPETLEKARYLYYKRYNIYGPISRVKKQKIVRKKAKKPKVTDCPNGKRLIKVAPKKKTKNGNAISPYNKCIKMKLYD